MADAFARIYGKDRVEVYSAGLRPSGAIDPRAIEVMRGVGYDLSRHQSTSLSDLPDIDFDFVATMGCGEECPAVREQRCEDWKLSDPKDMTIDQLRALRDLIEARVVRLLRELGVTGHRRWQ
jgi:protein-tyrosine-phosphatase